MCSHSRKRSLSEEVTAANTHQTGYSDYSHTSIQTCSTLVSSGLACRKRPATPKLTLPLKEVLKQASQKPAVEWIYPTNNDPLMPVRYLPRHQEPYSTKFQKVTRGRERMQASSNTSILTTIILVATFKEPNESNQRRLDFEEGWQSYHNEHSKGLYKAHS